MKKTTISLLLMLNVFSLSKALTKGEIKKLENDYVKIKDDLYASSIELSNYDYRLFLNDLKKENKLDEYNICKCDSAQWYKKFKFSYNEPMVAMYHWHPAFDNYPVVNITKVAADIYCQWLTDKYNNTDKRNFNKVKFRLPEEKEWKYLASPLPGHNLPWYGNFPYSPCDNNKTCSNTNVKIWSVEKENTNYVFDGGFYTLPSKTYKPNKLGVFDIIGNVSEMTSDGKIKGGSWDNYIEDCGIDKVQDFELPDPRVGCRIVMEIIEE